MMRFRAITAKKSNRRGSIAILAAALLIVVVAFLAFSADCGYIVVTGSELQNAADVGALSGARALPDGRDAAIAAAQLWAGKNEAAGKPVATAASTDVEIGKWDDESASFTVLPANSSDSANAVRVTCHRTAAGGNPLQLIFAPVIGTSSADLTAVATARIKSRCGLIVGITKVSMSGSSYTDSYNSANGPYSAAAAGNRGHVCSNGDIEMSGATEIHGDAHPGPDHTVDSSSSKGVFGEILPLTKPVSFPPVNPGDAASNNDNLDIPLSTKGNEPLNSDGEFALSGSDSVDLPPGKYYFSKLSLSGGSTIGISGPTEIYVTGDVHLGGGSVTNLTFLPKNLKLFPMGSKCVISGDSEFHGVVYGPTAKVERSGSADYFGAVVGGELVLGGSGGIHADEALDAQLPRGRGQVSKLVE